VIFRRSKKQADLLTTGQDNLEIKTPEHIAIIMDGNGRWAKQRNMPRVAGHRSGVDSVRKAVSECGKRGVKALTLFAFSSENWRRPENEVSLLMELFITVLKSEAKKLHKNNVRLRVVGDTTAFSEKLQKRIAEATELTKNNDGLVLNIAANYGGRWDVLNAMKKIVKQVQSGVISIDDINDDLMYQNLSFPDLPEPDLFIRTGGESRISNFLLWHLAYTELYFTDELWPDFNEDSLHKAIVSFSSRQRRFGRTGDQVESSTGA
jgi:undecaprenyl diphosphate synthase